MYKFELLNLSHARLFGVADENRLGWENEFAVLYAWNVSGLAEIAVIDGGYIVRTAFNGKTVYYAPNVSLDKYADALEFIKNECQQNGTPLYIAGITKNELQFYNGFELKTNRDSYDYVYSCNDLATLGGKKYHSKRNFVTRFFNSYDAQFREYTTSDYQAVIELENKWNSTAPEHAVAKLEKTAITRALENYRELGLKIGLLFANGTLASFSVSAVKNDLIAHTLFEKADVNFVGAYQAINKCVATEFLSGVKYVNRQEDMGLEGLRKVKLSYHPIMLIEKYSATNKQA